MLLLDRISQIELSPRSARLPLLFTAGWLLLMAIADLFTPLGFAHGVLYLPAVILMTLTRQPRWVWLTAAAAIGLTLLGVWLAPPSPPGIALHVVWANRIMALLMLVLVAALGHVLLLTFRRWRQLREADVARQEAMERTTREALERSAAHWQALAESMPVAVWTATLEGSLQYVSSALRPVAAEEPRQWLDLVHPDDQDRVGQAWAASQRARTPYTSECRVRQPDGSYRWVLTRAHFVAQDGAGLWYGSALDIHDRRMLEHEARQLAERLTATMESVTDGIVLLDTAGWVEYANGPALTLLHRTEDTLLRHDFWQVFAELRETALGQACQATLQDGRPRQVEIEIAAWQRRFEGNIYRYEQGLALYLRDVTVQRTLAEQLQRAQRLESLGQLTGGVAHDFNNLLTVILGNADLLREQVAETAPERQLASLIIQAAQRGSELTQRLLAFARRQPLAPVAVDLNRTLGDMEPLIRRALGETVVVELVQAGGLWLTQVDPSQLENAVLNLVFNARDAMPEGGCLTLETANAWLDDAYVRKQDGLKAGQYVMLAVTDTGGGMSAELLGRAFEPFFTTKELGKGSGLGLAMVYGFARQSGGHAAIYSEVGKGTTVKLYFPRLYRSQAATVPLPDEVVTEGRGQVVLLVEDDAMVRAYARAQLKSLGYQVIEAADGQAALEVVNSTQALDLLFTDVVMPGGLSGPQLAQAVRTIRPALPVLYTSGYTDNALVHQGRLDPDVLLLSKPYRRAELARKLQLALGGTGSGPVVPNPDLPRSE